VDSLFTFLIYKTAENGLYDGRRQDTASRVAFRCILQREMNYTFKMNKTTWIGKFKDDELPPLFHAYHTTDSAGCISARKFFS